MILFCNKEDEIFFDLFQSHAGFFFRIIFTLGYDISFRGPWQLMSFSVYGLNGAFNNPACGGMLNRAVIYVDKVLLTPKFQRFSCEIRAII